MGSFDFGEQLYETLLSLVDQPFRERIRQSLANFPYHRQFKVGELLLTVSAKLGAEVRRNADEEFLPLSITALSK